MNVYQHPSNVIQLQIKKLGFTSYPGQYIQICIPEISMYEWHPFTLTSSPNDQYLSIHIRMAGDWTKKTAQRLGCFSLHQTDVSAFPLMIPKILIDGPFGSGSGDVYDYTVALCVGAGIGITPFASILNDILYKSNHPDSSFKIQKIYFIWIAKDTHAFEWFHNLLFKIEEQLSHLIIIQTFITQKFNISDINNIFINDNDNERCTITRLKSKTEFGRPDLCKIFSSIAHNHKNTDVGVFYCGPEALSNSLSHACKIWTKISEKCIFHYAKENF